jgi:hypothetical protein
MSKADQFWQYAEEAMRWTVRSKTETEKHAFMELARTWTQLRCRARALWSSTTVRRQSTVPCEACLAKNSELRKIEIFASVQHEPAHEHTAADVPVSGVPMAEWRLYKTAHCNYREHNTPLSVYPSSDEWNRSTPAVCPKVARHRSRAALAPLDRIEKRPLKAE